MPTVIEQLARLPLFYPSLKMNKSIEHLLRERLDAHLDDVCVLVNIDSGSRNKPGGGAVNAWLEKHRRTVLLARLIVTIAQRGSNHE